MRHPIVSRLRTALCLISVLSLAAALAGCANPNKRSAMNAEAEGEGGAALAARNPNQSVPAPMTPARMAAYAGGAKFPSSKTASSDLKAAAILSRDSRTIKIYNFGNENIRDAHVWINRSYVRPNVGIAPQGSVVLSTAELYNSQGLTLAETNDSVSQVQLETMDSLYTLWGPAVE